MRSRLTLTRVVLGVAACTTLLVLVRSFVNSTTVALVLMLGVVFVATFGGRRPAIAASVCAVLAFNFFFLPPYGTFTIADPNNWVAFTAFLITSIIVGWLSSSARARAEEAEAGRVEVKRLYEELQASFQLASQAEALRQSERLKSALLDAVTHDIRTPLTSIKASVTTLLDEQQGRTFDELPVTLDDRTRREMLEVIDEESDRLNRFVEGLIELARIEAGEMRLRRHWSALEEIIETALARAAPLLRVHHIAVEMEREPLALRVDSRLVAEVIYTLIDNAAKYSEARTTIRIAANRDDSDDDAKVLIAVEDEGRGVPQELRERVFDKFFRATRDGDMSRHEPTGTGMGLAIAKGIVEAHKGRIWIEDKAEAQPGTRFVFTLPVGDDEDEQVATVSQSHGRTIER